MAVKRGIGSGKLKGGKQKDRKQKDRDNDIEVDIPFVNDPYEKSRGKKRISGVVECANMDETRKFKDKVQGKEPIETTRQRRNAWLALLGLGVTGWAAIQVATTNLDSKPNTSDNKKIVLREDEIHSYSGAAEDFKCRFIERYNEEYGTDYSVHDANIYINYLGSGLYETPDGKLVTPGSYPYETQEILSSRGGYTDNYSTESIFQVVFDEEKSDETVMTYSYETGEYIISGNSKDLSFELDREDFATLEKLGIDRELISSMFKVAAAEELGNEKAVSDYIEIYNQVIKEIDARNKSKEEGFEPGD